MGGLGRGVLAATPDGDEPGDGLAIDGKTLRGRRKPGAPGAPLLSALSHRLGRTLAPQAVDAKTQAIPALHDVRRRLVLAGRVITVEALLTQREVARTLVEEGGDSIMLVNGHQPPRPQDLPAVFQAPPRVADTRATTATGDLGHGRIAPRRLTTRTARRGDRDGPGLPQVGPIERRVLCTRTGQPREEGIDGVTSLAAARATPARLRSCARAHGPSENTSPWGRDVTCDEDRSPVRWGHIPPVLAALRHTVIGLRRGAGQTHMAAACRRFAAEPSSALALIGLELEN